MQGGVLMMPGSVIDNEAGSISIVEAFILGCVFERAWGKATSGEAGSVL